MVGSIGLNPVPAAAVSYDPLGRAMTEEQKARLHEQPSPPVDETQAKERVNERRREQKQGQGADQKPADDQEQGPGSIIDSFA